MKTNSDELEVLLLEAVANDFEEFADIENQVSIWSHRTDSSIANLEDTLRKLISIREVAASRLSPQSPHRVDVLEIGNDLHAMWFSITEQGNSASLIGQ